MSPPLQITEDTPPDMLAGSMDLCVVLPNGKDVRMSVERSTPMMDLLVQVTTANKISPAGHVIQAIGERGVMPYKPSTPIGALDTWTIYIVPKNQVGQIAGRKGYYKSVNQPFEQTFRLQVHLPRNQLYVSRISPKTRVSEILRQVCSEKNLDPSKYSLRHPVNLDQVLAGSCSLADYKLQEVALVSNRSRPVSGVSTVDIMALQQQRPVHATANHRSCEGSLSSGSLGGRSLSPTRSDESSASPPPLVTPVPHRPLRKRRPAPKPPVNNNNNNNLNNTVNNVVNKNNNNINSNPAVEASQPSQGATVICHSRNSSDSSGYHEASVLSESPESTNNSLPDSLPRRSKLPSNESNLESTSNVKSGGALSRSLSNLTTAVNSAVPRSIKTHSTSSTSLIAIGRKKKAAPAPPMARPLKMSSVSEERQKDISSPQSPLDDTSRKSSTLPATLRSTLHPQHSDVGSSSSSVCTPDTVDDLPAPSHLCPSFDLLQNTPSGMSLSLSNHSFNTLEEENPNVVGDGDTIVFEFDNLVFAHEETRSNKQKYYLPNNNKFIERALVHSEMEDSYEDYTSSNQISLINKSNRSTPKHSISSISSDRNNKIEDVVVHSGVENDSNENINFRDDSSKFIPQKNPNLSPSINGILKNKNTSPICRGNRPSPKMGTTLLKSHSYRQKSVSLSTFTEKNTIDRSQSLKSVDIDLSNFSFRNQKLNSPMKRKSSNLSINTKITTQGINNNQLLFENSETCSKLETPKLEDEFAQDFMDMEDNAIIPSSPLRSFILSSEGSITRFDSNKFKPLNSKTLDENPVPPSPIGLISVKIDTTSKSETMGTRGNFQSSILNLVPRPFKITNNINAFHDVNSINNDNSIINSSHQHNPVNESSRITNDSFEKSDDVTTNDYDLKVGTFKRLLGSKSYRKETDNSVVDASKSLKRSHSVADTTKGGQPHLAQRFSLRSTPRLPIKCNLLAPPPAGLLVDRRESIESWNKFVEKLNSIVSAPELDTRQEEYV